MSSEDDDAIERLSHTLALSSILLSKLPRIDPIYRDRSAAKRRKTEHTTDASMVEDANRRDRYVDWKSIVAGGPLGERFKYMMQLRKTMTESSADTEKDVKWAPMVPSYLHHSYHSYRITPIIPISDILARLSQRCGTLLCRTVSSSWTAPGKTSSWATPADRSGGC